MADTVAEQKETTPVESPEKKEKEIEKVPAAEPEEKAAENGDAKNNKENGSAEEKSETAENGEAKKDACSIKRKSTGGGDATDEGTPADGTPEKKAKLSDKAAEAESNGDSEAAKA